MPYVESLMPSDNRIAYLNQRAVCPQESKFLTKLQNEDKMKAKSNEILFDCSVLFFNALCLPFRWFSWVSPNIMLIIHILEQFFLRGIRQHLIWRLNASNYCEKRDFRTKFNSRLYRDERHKKSDLVERTEVEEQRERRERRDQSWDSVTRMRCKSVWSVCMSFTALDCFGLHSMWLTVRLKGLSPALRPNGWRFRWHINAYECMKTSYLRPFIHK